MSITDSKRGKRTSSTELQHTVASRERSVVDQAHAEQGADQCKDEATAGQMRGVHGEVRS